ncbi:MAG: septum formation protein Maf [Chloroflexota bacterium]|nr:septum formation protein Maf [Chloroflexota bacterium]
MILASTSPRRRELIPLFGLEFKFISADMDESPRAGEPPAELVRRLSRAKAALGARVEPTALVVAADTVVALDNTILGKPQDAADATRMLKLLRARAHVVYSGVTVARSARQITHVATTTVWMRDYSDAEIAGYVATGDPLDKAAAYAIQHRAFRPVARIDGCHANVMGLPLCHLYRALKAFGVARNEPDRACQAHLQIVCPVASEILSRSVNQ